MPAHARFSGVSGRALCLTLLLSMAACGESNSELGPPRDLVISRISQPAFSGYDLPQRLVIRTEADWMQAWQTLWRRAGEVPPLPPVDFAHDLVIIAAAGARPTSGYFIVIEAATATGRGVTIRVRTIVPGAGCIVLPVGTQPADVVRIEQRGLVIFEEFFEARSCT